MSLPSDLVKTLNACQVGLNETGPVLNLLRLEQLDETLRGCLPDRLREVSIGRAGCLDESR
jgi:hypothetical protein